MSVKLSVPAHLLVRPDVSQAVQALILALGGKSAAARQMASRAASAQPTPAKAASPTKARRAKPESSPAPQKMSLEEFVASLPENSRRFIEIVRERGVIKASEMVRLLGLKNAKAVGGITGAIGRWGPARGVELPYERITLEGERAWRWLTGDAGERREARTVPAAPVTPISFPLPAPAPRRRRSKKSEKTEKATKSEKAAQTEKTAKAAKAAKAEKAEKAASKAPSQTAATDEAAAQTTSGAPTTVDGILDTLSPTARRLAVALREAGTLDGTQAATTAGVAIGDLRDLLKEINGAASHLDQRLALDDLDVTGNVTYKWLGLQAKAPKKAPTTAEKLAEKAKEEDENAEVSVAPGGLIRRRRRA